MWEWYIQFFRRYNLVDEVWIWADTKQEALQKLRQTTPVLEVICCIKKNKGPAPGSLPGANKKY